MDGPSVLLLRITPFATRIERQVTDLLELHGNMTFRQQSDNLEPETEKPPNEEKTRPAHTRNAQARNIGATK
ncbi:MAG: hypothetical protein JSS39_04635 [Nitrospira sp.]|nr:hypothetical protein [Nitrospira sp.]